MVGRRLPLDGEAVTIVGVLPPGFELPELEHADVLLAFKLAVVVAFAVLSLRRDVRLEDKAFAIAVLLQMLMYAGRPLLGAMRYLLLVYPVFIVMAGYAERWKANRLRFLLAAMGALDLVWLWAFLNWSLVL